MLHEINSYFAVNKVYIVEKGFIYINCKLKFINNYKFQNYIIYKLKEVIINS